MILEEERASSPSFKMSMSFVIFITSVSFRALSPIVFRVDTTYLSANQSNSSSDSQNLVESGPWWGKKVFKYRQNTRIECFLKYIEYTKNLFYCTLLFFVSPFTDSRPEQHQRKTKQKTKEITEFNELCTAILK